MTSSRAGAPRQVAAPPGSRESTPYSRFIPREELPAFANWMPGALADGAAAAPSSNPARPGAASAHPRQPNQPSVPARPGEAAPTAADLHAARQAGYQDGYRDGLVALESFKHSAAQQMSAQFAPLLHSFDAQLGALDGRIAATVAQVATELARQVVRSELQTRPQLVAQVAQEAVQAVLLSARHIVVQVNPADFELIQRGAADALAAHGARLVGQQHVERGGCLVETDAGTIDARIEARWHDAVQALGTAVAWSAAAPAPAASAASAVTADPSDPTTQPHTPGPAVPALDPDPDAAAAA